MTIKTISSIVGIFTCNGTRTQVVTFILTAPYDDNARCVFGQQDIWKNNNKVHILQTIHQAQNVYT